MRASAALLALVTLCAGCATSDSVGDSASPVDSQDPTSTLAPVVDQAAPTSAASSSSTSTTLGLVDLPEGTDHLPVGATVDQAASLLLDIIGPSDNVSTQLQRLDREAPSFASPDDASIIFAAIDLLGIDGAVGSTSSLSRIGYTTALPIDQVAEMMQEFVDAEHPEWSALGGEDLSGTDDRLGWDRPEFTSSSVQPDVEVRLRPLDGLTNVEVWISAEWAGEEALEYAEARVRGFEAAWPVPPGVLTSGSASVSLGKQVTMWFGHGYRIDGSTLAQALDGVVAQLDAAGLVPEVPLDAEDLDPDGTILGGHPYFDALRVVLCCDTDRSGFAASIRFKGRLWMELDDVTIG